MDLGKRILIHAKIIREKKQLGKFPFEPPSLHGSLSSPVGVEHDELDIEHVLLGSRLVNQVVQVQALQRRHSL
jgi:hypothetical protein